MSSTIEVVRYQNGHSLLLDMSESDAGWLKSPAVQFDAQAAAGHAVTMLIGYRVACIGGVARLWDGLGEVWMVPSPLAREYPLALTKAAWRTIDYAMTALELRRAQCFCKTSDSRAIRWAQALGFKREGTLRKYGADGSDYEVMAIVR